MDLCALCAYPDCPGGKGERLKNPMDVGSTPLEGSPLLKHPFVPPDCVGLELREGIPVLLLFSNKGKVFPHL